MTEPTYVDWIRAARASHERLAGLAAGLTEEQLSSQSYDTEWTVAQVLSHLGSGAEIFGRILDAQLTGADAPGGEQFQAIWAVWDAKGPVAMRDDSLAANSALVSRLEAVTPEQAGALTFAFGPFSLDLAGFVRMRLSEHALHTWDVAEFLDPSAVVAQDAVALLLPGVGMMAGRGGKPADPAYAVKLVTTDGLGDWAVTTGDPVTFGPAEEGAEYDGVVSLPGESVLRLIAGRLDPDHTPAGVSESGARGLADLRTVFPGF